MAQTKKLMALSSFAAFAFAQAPAEPDSNAYYQFSTDSMVQEGIPKGQIKGPFGLQSQAHPGTQHIYWVYVPAQYNSAKPASLMIYNDGQAFMAMDGDIRAQVVLDS